MAINWSNTAAKEYVLLLRNGIQTGAVMPGIMSETQVDVLTKTGEVYRDEIDAAMLGRSVQGSVITAQDITNPATITGTVGPNVAAVAPDSGNTTIVPITDPQFDESDVFNHVAPHPLISTRSRLIWWSAAGGTGNVVGHCWEDQYISLTPVEMERF